MARSAAARQGGRHAVPTDDPHPMVEPIRDVDFAIHSARNGPRRVEARGGAQTITMAAAARPS